MEGRNRLLSIIRTASSFKGLITDLREEQIKEVFPIRFRIVMARAYEKKWRLVKQANKKVKLSL
jgi:hypothetical protein